MKWKAVIIEDDPSTLVVVKGLLGDAGCEVVGEGGDGESAVEICSSVEPDVVLMDIGLPGIDGIEAATKVSEACSLPVVIMTGAGDDETVRRAVDAGVMAYLTKPVRGEDLLPAIELAVSRFGEFEELRSENTELKETLAARKIIEKAKGLLMEKEGLSEQDAFRRIQKTAMAQRRSMKEVAEVVVATMSAAISGGESV